MGECFPRVIITDNLGVTINCGVTVCMFLVWFGLVCLTVENWELSIQTNNAYDFYCVHCQCVVNVTTRVITSQPGQAQKETPLPYQSCA